VNQSYVEILRIESHVKFSCRNIAGESIREYGQ